MNLKRDEEILKLIDEAPSQFISVESLASYFNISESTIRRELKKLADLHKLARVHGGATTLNFSGTYTFERLDREYLEREKSEVEIKQQVAKCAASHLKSSSLIYLDASTTVASMIPYIPKNKNLKFVTNSPTVASRLMENGLPCYVTCGELKLLTNALIGSFALEFLDKFNFSTGFFGTNGIHYQAKYTTPDPEECEVKVKAMSRCYEVFILADHTKLGNIASSTFSDFSRPTLIIDKVDEKYKNLIKNIEIAM